MKKYFLGLASVVLAFLVSGVPAALVYAEEGESVAPTTAVASTSTPVRPALRQDVKNRIKKEVRQEVRNEIKKEVREDMREQKFEQKKAPFAAAVRERVMLMRESTTTPAISLDELKQMREKRRLELEQEEASTTPKVRGVVKNANPVRLAVHTLLASKELLGGIGPQVSEIAKRMNDSIATTTDVEAQIESRGFFKKLFLGGDREAAATLNGEVKSNQERIAELTALLGQADISDEVRTELTAQVNDLQAAQARLQDLAQKEQKRWGIFSWRLFGK